MKKILLLITAICTIYIAQAQTSAVYSFGDSLKSCVGDAGFIDVDGNYVMMGRRSTGNQYAKFDANHAMLWSFITPSSTSQGWRMFQTANKDYIGILATGFSGFIIRISSNGTIVWNRTLGQITSIRDGFEDTNGDLYFVGGWTNRNIVMRLDANGNEIWAKKITNGNGIHQGAAINPTADGNLMICGVTQSSSGNPVGIALSKVSKAGALLWGNTYETPTLSITPLDMEISTLDQSVMIAGHAYSNVGAYDVNTNDAVIVKIDSAGGFVNMTSLGVSTKEDRFTAITQVPYPNNPLFVMSGFSKTTTGATKLLLSSVDNAGSFVTTKTYGDNHGNGFFWDQINYDPTHGLNVMGTGSGFFVANASEYQFARMDTSLTLPCKAFTHTMVQNNYNLNASGTFVIASHILGYDSTAFTIVVDSITAFNSCTGDSIISFPSNTQHIAKATVDIYPNPVLGQLNIDLGENKINRLAIYDVLGNRIFESQKETSLLSVETSRWAEGIYLIDISTKDEERLMRKVLVQ